MPRGGARWRSGDPQSAARSLRRGARDLERRLPGVLADVADRIEPAARASARRVLPKRGGLNEWTARLTVEVKGQGGTGRPAVTAVASLGKHDLQAINRGRIMHRVYGRKLVGPQMITPGFWDKALADPALTARAADAVHDAAQRTAEAIVDDAKK